MVSDTGYHARRLLSPSSFQRYGDFNKELPLFDKEKKQQCLQKENFDVDQPHPFLITSSGIISWEDNW